MPSNNIKYKFSKRYVYDYSLTRDRGVYEDISDIFEVEIQVSKVEKTDLTNWYTEGILTEVNKYFPGLYQVYFILDGKVNQEYDGMELEIHFYPDNSCANIAVNSINHSTADKIYVENGEIYGEYHLLNINSLPDNLYIGQFSLQKKEGQKSIRIQ